MASHLSQSEIQGPIRSKPAAFLASSPTIFFLAHSDPVSLSLLVCALTRPCPNPFLGPEHPSPDSPIADVFLIGSAEISPSQMGPSD